jgi:hypothetical protein
MAAILLALAPVAQADVASFSVPPCASMMQPGMDHACCANKCDCTIETRTAELMAILPVMASVTAAPQAPALTSLTLDIPASHDGSLASSEEGSPPAPDPLYQAYSDYRL